MAKKMSGLGRGLGDLFEDNAPEVRQGQGSVVRQDGGPIGVTPPPVVSTVTIKQSEQKEIFYSSTPKSLYEERPKNKSLKANFKNFNR